MGKFSAIGITRVVRISVVQRNIWLEIRKQEISFVLRCQWTCGNLQCIVHDETGTETIASEMLNLRLSK